MAQKRLSITVTGRVQGVGYRFYTRDVAESLGVCGWVRNSYDRTVECEAQAEESVLIEFVKKLEQGPPLSWISNVFTVEMPFVESEAGFDISH